MLLARPDLFRSQDDITESLRNHLCELRTSGPEGASVRLPGDRAAELVAENTEWGVPVLDSVYADLVATAALVGLDHGPPPDERT
jgi:LDH2 family malate/lactate/ureidoglycolate dehydrogenase